MLHQQFGTQSQRLNTETHLRVIEPQKTHIATQANLHAATTLTKTNLYPIDESVQQDNFTLLKHASTKKQFNQSEM